MQKEVSQEIRGVLSLRNIKEIDPDLKIKIAIFRDCRIIHSQVFKIEPSQRELQYSLAFKTEGTSPMGVRLVIGPGDAGDEELRSLDVIEQWVSAKAFKERVARVDIEIQPPIYSRWRIFCRRYTIRGRVVCRRIVFDWRTGRFTICDAPVRGAKVTAFDVDSLWWWCRRDAVGSDFTDVNGYFEISFSWCCWIWRPWFFKDWKLDPELFERISKLLKNTPIPLPDPDPEPDFTVFNRMVEAATIARGGGTRALAATDVTASGSFGDLGGRLAQVLPASPELEALRIWPWWPFFDCKPDIVFKVTQDCGDGEKVIYSESCGKTRWNIDQVTTGVVLVANSNACCGPFCCTDRPDADCLVFQGVGCGGYPITAIEQDPMDPLLGYADPGGDDRPFGGSIRILGVFGDGSVVDYYKFQSRRISPTPTAWADLPDDQIGAFTRSHWLGVSPWFQPEAVKMELVGGQMVLRTTKRYREEHPEVSTTVDPINDEMLTVWQTSTTSNPAPGVVQESPNLSDGIYELRVVGYRYNSATKTLYDQKIMPICPGPGGEVDPAKLSGMYLRLDNRIATLNLGSVHWTTDEPDCDFPDVCAVVKNEGEEDEQCVDSCGIVRLNAGDTLTVHFRATDADGHLEAYAMSAHWGESEVFDVISAGDLAGDPDQLFGPTYAATFAGAQGAYRAGLPPLEPEHDRPFWYGGDFKVTVTVDDQVPFTDHTAFETCCAYLLRLEVWKRTTNGCTTGYNFHRNQCEFSFTVIREDLIGDPDNPSCTE